MTTLATVENMEIAHRTYGKYPLAISLHTDEEYSGCAGDYFYKGKNSPLMDNEGFPMILVYRSEQYCDALTGEQI